MVSHPAPHQCDNDFGRDQFSASHDFLDLSAEHGALFDFVPEQIAGTQVDEAALGLESLGKHPLAGAGSPHDEDDPGGSTAQYFVGRHEELLQIDAAAVVHVGVGEELSDRLFVVGLPDSLEEAVDAFQVETGLVFGGRFRGVLEEEVDDGGVFNVGHEGLRAGLVGDLHFSQSAGV